MKNIHQPSEILSKEEFEKIEKAFQKAWCKETTYQDVWDSWTEDNKALGQCAVTSVIIYDLYGGKLAYDKSNSHFWNELPDGSEQDFTRCQFKDETVFNKTEYRTKDRVLYDENGIKKHTSERYQLLKLRFEKEYRNIS